ncbi:hypothetical protein Tco_1025443, partial [Tanacetum coccineum]
MVQNEQVIVSVGDDSGDNRDGGGDGTSGAAVQSAMSAKVDGAVGGEKVGGDSGAIAETAGDTQSLNDSKLKKGSAESKSKVTDKICNLVLYKLGSRYQSVTPPKYVAAE